MRNIRDFEATLLRELEQSGVINNKGRASIIKEQTSSKIPMWDIIYKNGIASKEFMAAFLAQKFEAKEANEAVFVSEYTVITDELFEKYRVIADIVDEANARIYFDSPVFAATWEELSSELGREIEKIAVDREAFARMSDVLQNGMEMRRNFSLSSDKDLAKIPENIRAIKFAEEVIRKCISIGASDIHIEPQKHNFRIRMRFNGVLQVFGEYGKNFFPSFSSRIKLISNLNIAEKRDTQDGALVYSYNEKAEEDTNTSLKAANFFSSFNSQNKQSASNDAEEKSDTHSSEMVYTYLDEAQERKDVPFRVSVMPVIYGEKIVLRRLGGQDVTIKLSSLGMSGELLEKWRKVIKKPHGIILVSGPTGSGKSTTLQAAIEEIKSDEINITTVEDPVEAKISGVNQVQIDPYKVSFADALRTILRQDPDVIMIGEIRDKETAEIALRASLTGHLVYSTIHTNDAPSSVTRLVDMGIEPFLVSSSVAAVLAQRLVRVLCPHCKEAYETSQADMSLLKLDEPQTIYRHKGCFKCNNTGYASRIGVYELLIIDAHIQRMINERRSDIEIKSYAVSELGMSTIYMETRAKVLEGITSVDELRKVVAD
ncbi:MAG: type II/IV secretion system protein [Campylobacterales bacterium]|nr:type II/IV secretion system protein [Campylobacterales bacterium]